jgi:hypothetical protein
MIKTSTFGKYVGCNGVSIARFEPKWFIGERYKSLAPPTWMLDKFKLGELSELEYTELYYYFVLNKLNPYQVLKDLDGKTMLCHCEYFCHRHIAAEWLTRKTGVEVVESIR